MDDIRKTLDEAQTVCKKAIEKSEEWIERGQRLHKARAMQRLTRYFLSVTQDVTPPDQITFMGLQKLGEDLETIQQEVGQGRAMWFSLISPMFKVSRNRIDVAFKKMAKSLKELRSFLAGKYLRVKAIDETFSIIDKVYESFDELEKTRRRIEVNESARKALEKRIEKCRQRIAQIQTKSEVADLSVLNQRVGKLKRDAKYHFRHLEKPLVKLQRRSQNAEKGLSAIETQKLSDYIKNPFVALATEEKGYPILREILLKMDALISQGKLKLKSSRRRKAQEKILNIVNEDKLVSLHGSLKDVYLQRKMLECSETTKSFQNEQKQLQKRLEELKKKKELEDSRQAFREREYNKKLKKFETQKIELEKMVIKTTSKNIKVVL